MRQECSTLDHKYQIILHTNSIFDWKWQKYTRQKITNCAVWR